MILLKISLQSQCYVLFSVVRSFSIEYYYVSSSFDLHPLTRAPCISPCRGMSSSSFVMESGWMRPKKLSGAVKSPLTPVVETNTT